MKKIYLLVILISITTMSWGQGIEFFKGSYTDILEKAKKEGKNIFVDVYTSWCGPCKLMAKNVFSDEQVGQYYNANFVCVKLDAEIEKKHGFFEKYQASGYPSLFWLNSTGNLVEMNVGMMTPSEFIEKGKGIKTSNKIEERAEYQKRWEQGERSKEVFDKYVLEYVSKIEPRKFKPYCEMYLKTLNEEQLKSKDVYNILNYFRQELKPGIVYDCQMKYWNNYKTYEDYLSFSRSRYRWIVRVGIVESRKSEKALEDHIALLKKTDFPQKEMFLEIMNAEVKLSKKQYESLSDFYNITQKYGEENPFIYIQFAYSLVNAEYFAPSNTDTTHLAKVKMITERAYELFPSKETAVYLAATYAKEGDLQRAYNTMGALPFLSDPVLSNALYSKLGLFKRPKTDYGKTPDARKMKGKVAALQAGKINK